MNCYSKPCFDLNNEIGQADCHNQTSTDAMTTVDCSMYSDCMYGANPCLKDGGNCAPADDSGFCTEGKKCDYFRDNYDYDWGTNKVDGFSCDTFWTDCAGCESTGDYCGSPAKGDVVCGRDKCAGHHNSTGYDYSNDQMYDNWMPNYNNAYEIIMYSDDSCGEEDDSFSTYMQSDFQSSCDHDWDLQHRLGIEKSLQHTCLVQGTQTSYEIKMSADNKCGGKSNINCLVFSFAFLLVFSFKTRFFIVVAVFPPVF